MDVKNRKAQITYIVFTFSIFTFLFTVPHLYVFASKRPGWDAYSGISLKDHVKSIEHFDFDSEGKKTLILTSSFKYKLEKGILEEYIKSEIDSKEIHRAYKFYKNLGYKLISERTTGPLGQIQEGFLIGSIEYKWEYDEKGRLLTESSIRTENIKKTKELYRKETIETNYEFEKEKSGKVKKSLEVRSDKYIDLNQQKVERVGTFKIEEGASENTRIINSFFNLPLESYSNL